MTIKEKIRNNKNDIYCISTLLITALICHGLLIINDGTYWDGWAIKDLLISGDWGTLHKMMDEMGLHIEPYFFWSLRALRIINYQNILAFTFICLTSVFIFFISKIILQNRFDSFSIAVLSMTFPAYQMSVQLCTLQYLLFYFIFTVATFLLLTKTTNKFINLATRSISVALFYISFETNSLLVFYAIPMALALILEMGKNKPLGPKFIMQFALKRIDYMVIPFLYFFIKITYFKTHGMYEGYNSISLDQDKIIKGISLFWNIAFIGKISSSLELLSEASLKIILLSSIVFVAAGRYLRTPEFNQPQTMRHSTTVSIFLFGAFAFLCASFPYSVVGDPPSPSGVASRHALLVGVPAALMMVAYIRSMRLVNLSSSLPQFTDRTIGSYLMTGLLTVAFSWASINYYVDWQVQSIKDKAVMKVLSQVDRLKPYSIYWINDQHPYGKNGVNDFFVWATMFKDIWGGQSRIGLETQLYHSSDLPRLSTLCIRLFNLADCNLKGPEVTLTISHGARDISDVMLVRDYVKTRLFGKESSYQLKDLIHVYVNLPPKDEDLCIGAGKDTSKLVDIYKTSDIKECAVSFGS